MSRISIEICTDSPSQGVGRGGTKPDEEAEYEECWPGRRHGTAKRKGSISSEGGDHYDSSTVHLAQRTEKQRSEYITDQEHRYGKGILLVFRDVKVICSVEDGSAWKRRGNG